ncbi:hypothetical protein BC567DRAFT_235115 [Phyllosticta citribraziliensis]
MERVLSYRGKSTSLQLTCRVDTPKYSFNESPLKIAKYDKCFVRHPSFAIWQYILVFPMIPLSCTCLPPMQILTSLPVRFTPAPTTRPSRCTLSSIVDSHKADGQGDVPRLISEDKPNIPHHLLRVCLPGFHARQCSQCFVDRGSRVVRGRG